MIRTLPLLVCLLPAASAQFYNISTVAGIGRLPFSDGGGAAINAHLIQPRFAAADTAGNVFFSDSYYNQVFQISAAGTITVYAGTGQSGFGGDGGPATAAQISNPQGLAVDSAGNLYIAEFGNSRVRKVTPGGTISTVAGNGQTSLSGDGGSATSAAVGNPAGVAIDAAGSLYVSQPNANAIRMVSSAGTISTLAGTGAAGYSGDGLQATAAMLFAPQGLTVDAAGNVYVADWQNNRIRKITPQGVITTVAGNGKNGFSGDGQQATAASLFFPLDVKTDSNGNLYVADASNGRVRLVNSSGVISTFAGGGGSFQDGAPGQAGLLGLTGVAIDSKGNVIITLSALRQVRRVTQQAITTIAGVLPSATGGDNVLATTAPLLDPYGVAADATGNLYIADQIDNRIRRVSAGTGIITTVAGNGLDRSTGDGGPAIRAEIGVPRGLSLDPAGNLYIASGAGTVIRRIAPDGTIATAAGSGTAGFSGDGGIATSAQLLGPVDAVGDAAGNVYIADSNNNRIRLVSPSKVITTFAGTGVAGYSGDNGPAASAQVFLPRQLALDSKGNLYVTDTYNNRIRKITPTGTITTVAGTGVGGFAGDGGAATDAQLSLPTSVAVDSSGNLYIGSAARIRKVDASTGTIALIAGTGTAGFSGDGGLATLATINQSQNITLDGSGNVYFTDEGNSRVRKLTPAQIVREGVANGGSHTAGAVAPGEVITIFGFNLGPVTAAGLQLDANGRVATQLAGTQVLFDGVPAPLLLVASGQVNTVVPYGVAGQTSTQLQVVAQGKPTNVVTLPVAASSPGLAAITNQDGSVNSQSSPAAAESALAMYGTGEGQTNPPGVDGNVATSVFPKPVLPVSVQIGGRAASIPYVGAAPGFVSGVLQLNVQIPVGVTGAVPLQLQIGDATLPSPLTVFVR